MSKDLAKEIAKSLKEYAAKVEQAYHERPLCHFDWKLLILRLMKPIRTK